MKLCALLKHVKEKNCYKRGRHRARFCGTHDADEFVFLGPFDNSSAQPMLNSAPSAFGPDVAPSLQITYIASGL